METTSSVVAAQEAFLQYAAALKIVGKLADSNEQLALFMEGLTPEELVKHVIGAVPYDEFNQLPDLLTVVSNISDNFMYLMTWKMRS